MKESGEGIIYTDAIISQLGIGCLEFKALRRDGKDGQEINVYSQLHGQSKNGWGTCIFSGSLTELIEFVAKGNTAIAMISQIGAMVKEKLQ